jgi:hypothetical protein
LTFPWSSSNCFLDPTASATSTMAYMTYLISLLCGILGEVVLFSRGEWDRHAPRIVQISALLAGGSTLLLWNGVGLTLAMSLQETVLHGAAACAGLFGSMTVYRLFFHRLRAFPGPVAARVSAFWVIKEHIPNMKFYVKVRELHDQYGDFVRISRLPITLPISALLTRTRRT